MTMRLCNSWLLLAALAGAAPTGLAQDNSPAPPLPSWETLDFSKQQFGVTAQARIEIVKNTKQSHLTELKVNSSIAGNTEQLTLRYHTDGGGLRSKSRLSEGRNTRLKQYRYHSRSLTRERREPGWFSSNPAAQWPLSSEREISYPAGLSRSEISDPYALLLYASACREAACPTEAIAVHVDHRFYEVRLDYRGQQQLATDYRLDTRTDGNSEGGGDKRSRAHTASVIGLRVQVFGETTGNAQDSEFNLLGFIDDISILTDSESGLPLQIRGRVPRLGETELNLSAATLVSSPQ